MIIFALTILMLIAGCSDKSEKLTEAAMQDLQVPQNFDYQMSRMIEIDLRGAHRVPLTITSMDDKILYRGMMNPATGIVTKINLTSVTRKVRVIYHAHDLELSISNNSLSHDFTNN